MKRGQKIDPKWQVESKTLCGALWEAAYDEWGHLRRWRVDEGHWHIASRRTRLPFPTTRGE